MKLYYSLMNLKVLTKKLVTQKNKNSRHIKGLPRYPFREMLVPGDCANTLNRFLE